MVCGQYIAGNGLGFPAILDIHLLDRSPIPQFDFVVLKDSRGRARCFQTVGRHGARLLIERASICFQEKFTLFGVEGIRNMFVL